jgi:hypothetical protein
MFQFRALVLAACAVATLRADVTMRYKTNVKLNPSLPAAMTQQATKGMQNALPPEMVVQWKQGKGASAFGPFQSIVDVEKQQITLIDPAKKRVATATSQEILDEFAKAITALPPEARAAMASMKATVDSKITGRTSAIQGVDAEEREVVLSIEGPPSANMPPGPMIKMAIQFWIAKDEAIARSPALRELQTNNQWSFATMNPAAGMERMLQQMPGMGQGMGKFFQEMQAAKAVLLRNNVTMWMPAVAAMMKMLPPEKNPFGAGFNADAPFMEMVQEVSEISDATIPDSVFAVPAGMKPVPAAELVRDMMAAGRGESKQ